MEHLQRVACQQGTLTFPDTWFRPPLWDLLVLQLLRPDSSNLPCLYSTFHLEYSLVLSRFCFVNQAIADPSSLKGLANSGGSKFVGFGPTSFSSKFKSKDFEIYGSSLGKSVPSCDKLCHNLYGAKSVEGLQLSQSLWVKSENCLHYLSHVLGTAEHFWLLQTAY